MCKRSFAVILVFAMLFSISVHAFATDNPVEDVIYFEDGSYITITIMESVARASNTKTATKLYEYTSSTGNLEWEASLTGKFTYDGTSSSCIGSSVDVTVHESNWYLDSKRADRDGRSALGTVIMCRTVLLVTVATETYELSLTCDKDGNLT